MQPIQRQRLAVRGKVLGGADEEGDDAGAKQLEGLEQQGFVRGFGALGKGSQKQRLGKDVRYDGRNAVVGAGQKVMQVLDQCARSVRAGQAEESGGIGRHFQRLSVGEAAAQGGQGGGKFQQPSG